MAMTFKRLSLDLEFPNTLQTPEKFGFVSQFFSLGSAEFEQIDHGIYKWS